MRPTARESAVKVASPRSVSRVDLLKFNLGGSDPTRKGRNTTWAACQCKFEIVQQFRRRLLHRSRPCSYSLQISLLNDCQKGSTQPIAEMFRGSKLPSLLSVIVAYSRSTSVAFQLIVRIETSGPSSEHLRCAFTIALGQMRRIRAAATGREPSIDCPQLFR
jgi:hypothetical protein